MKVSSKSEYAKELAHLQVEADDKRAARLNLIAHLLDRIPYERVDREPIEFPRARSAPMCDPRPPPRATCQSVSRMKA